MRLSRKARKERLPDRIRKQALPAYRGNMVFQGAET